MVFRNTRMPVSAVFENLEIGATVEEIIEQFDITRELEWTQPVRQPVKTLVTVSPKSRIGCTDRESKGGVVTDSHWGSR
jgi:Protein of unknown function (DUF433)